MHQSFNSHRRRHHHHSYSELFSTHNSNMAECPYCIKTILLLILIFFIPPLAVYFVQKQCNSTVVLNLILYLIVWIPGVIHALYVIYFSWIDLSLLFNCIPRKKQNIHIETKRRRKTKKDTTSELSSFFFYSHCKGRRFPDAWRLK